MKAKREANHAFERVVRRSVGREAELRSLAELIAVS
jgi:hypothetical protein